MSSTRFRYRSEIDGLRAVAVLPVIIFHSGSQWMPGGYVGVDIFFVISGFLITGILMREHEAGAFSILRFYERRARRILPALFTVIAVTSILAVFLMLPYELRDFAKSVISVVAFVSNIFFWREANYFATDAERLPLLHTWSLSVEEQFYIIFPIALWVFWKYWRAALVPAMIVVSLASLVLAELMVSRVPGAVFYLLPTRGWELLAGSLSAIYLLRRAKPNRVSGEILGGFGLLAIVYSILSFDAGTPFPSLWALFPVLGTVGILVGASDRTLVGRLLSWRPAVAIGLISYSAYLWHQPLFAFARVATPDGNPAAWLMGMLGLASLILAWVSWRYVETPFRRRGAFNARQIFLQSCAGAAALLGLAAVFLLSQGLAVRFPQEQRAWLVTSPNENGSYVRDGYRTVMNAPLSAQQPNLVILGDSFSQDFYNMVVENGFFADHAISTIYVPVRCQLNVGFAWRETRAFINAGNWALCSRSGLSGKQRDMVRRAQVVVIAFSWLDWSAARFAQVLRNMDLSDDQKVFVIGSKRFRSRQEVLRLDRPRQAKADPPPLDVETTRMLREQLPEDVFVDTLSLLCPEGCPLFTPGGELISYDGSHLSPAGARYVGEILFSSRGLSAYRP